MNEKQKRQIDNLRDAGYLHSFETWARRMCAPFFWSRTQQGHPPEILGNGTICFLDTGTMKLGVTAAHVYQQFVKDHSEQREVEAQFGFNTVHPIARLIDQDEEVDLATFDLPEVFVTAGPEAFYSSAVRWPPNPITRTDVCLYGGYPQVLRNRKSGRIEFGFQYFTTAVSDVAFDRLVLHPDMEHLYWPGHEGEKMNEDFGGHSGGPVYRVIDASIENGEPVDRLELVGFIFQRIGPAMLARPAAHLAADGSIVRH